MNRLIVITAVVALVVGGFGGFLWRGWPTGPIESDVRDARAAADRFDQQLAELRTQNDRLRTQLEDEQKRAEAAERDLRTEKGISSRLHMLVSQGKK